MEGKSKYYGENGIHRVPLWRIGGFTLNNTATNLYLILMMYVAYYLTGFVGVAVVAASSFSMVMRIWDGVTDPFIGYLVDKTNGKFGKNRPFMVIGQVILLVTSYILFHVTALLPEGGRYFFFIVIAAVYYIGYTFQCVVTKSAQTCLTNDPKQRPLFAMFDAGFNTVLFAVMTVVVTNIATKNGGFYVQETWNQMWLIVALLSLVFTAIAVISIAPKDKSEFFGTGVAVKVGFKDYWDTIKGNRAIQMLIVSASSDKLASSMRTSTIYIVLFGLIAGNYAIYGKMTGVVTIPSTIVAMAFVAFFATKMGQRKAMIFGSVGGIILNVLFIFLWIFGDSASMIGGTAESPAINWSFFAIAYFVLCLLVAGFTGISGNIVIPMTADCADYEVYRTGKYVPGLMGTLFSLVDKLISAFAPLITGVLLAAIGFKEKLPDANTKLAELNTAGSVYQGINIGGILPVALFLAYGTVIIGLILNLIALKFYPLTKEYMAEIQGEIAKIKAQAGAAASPATEETAE